MNTRSWVKMDTLDKCVQNMFLGKEDISWRYHTINYILYYGVVLRNTCSLNITLHFIFDLISQYLKLYFAFYYSMCFLITIIVSVL